MIITDMAVIEVGEEGLTLVEHAPGLSVEDIQSVTDAPLRVSGELREMELLADPR